MTQTSPRLLVSRRETIVLWLLGVGLYRPRKRR